MDARSLRSRRGKTDLKKINCRRGISVYCARSKLSKWYAIKTVKSLVSDPKPPLSGPTSSTMGSIKITIRYVSRIHYCWHNVYKCVCMYTNIHLFVHIYYVQLHIYIDHVVLYKEFPTAVALANPSVSAYSRNKNRFHANYVSPVLYYYIYHHPRSCSRRRRVVIYSCVYIYIKTLCSRFKAAVGRL